MSIQPEILREKYSKFLQTGRVLLTGHSHQAWPDCAIDGVVEAFNDAVNFVDDKWERAFAKAESIRLAIAANSHVPPASVALGQNTHELFCRFLSALPEHKTHIVTTSGEFHSVRRQLIALEQRGIEVSWVSAHPTDNLSDRLIAATTPKTAAIVCSSVLFETASIVPHLDELVEQAVHRGVEVFLDGYHAFMAIPTTFNANTTSHAFLSGGGYKYAQWGEGVCWMSIPEHFEGKPAFTGWFSDFKNLGQLRSGNIGYGDRKADAFTGSTYDPTSHYRAARVSEFFTAENLTIEALRALSIRQTSALIDTLGDGGLISPHESDKRGGFVTYAVENAAELVTRLRAQDIFADARGDYIRFGPAPYVTFEEIESAAVIIKKLMKPLSFKRSI